MRIIFLFVLMIFSAALKAQTVFPGSFQNNNYSSAFVPDINIYDSSAKKKWFISRYTGVTAGYSFFRGGSANFVAAPIGIQLNRRLNNNLYAFASISAAPAYINFNRAFITTDLNKVNAGNSFYKANNFAMYSSAAMGVMYINNEKTFSISGSISIEKSSAPVYFYNKPNATQSNHIISSP